MDKLLYVAMSGAKSAMTRQATNNNNLANFNTSGFKEDLDATISYNAPGKAFASRVYADVRPSGINGSSGQIINTERELDVAIQGEGLIAVMNPDGSEAYTRSGNLRVSPTGVLETSAGAAVMGDNGPIIISPYDSLEIAQDGTISITPLGDESGTLAVLDRIKLVNPDSANLQKNEDGTLSLPATLSRKTTVFSNQDDRIESQVADTFEQPPALAADGTVQIMSGALETSNVNPTKALVTMVELGRIFEMQMKLMKTAEDNDVAATRILS